jgi:hypothetical protein
MMGGRMLVLSADAVKLMQDRLYKKFSTGASVIILEMGLSYGSMVFELLDKKSKQTQESEPLTARSISQVLFKEGLGKFSFSGDLENGRNLSVSINNCAFCGNGDLGDNCNFLRGIVVALTGGLFQRQYKSKISCSVSQTTREHLCQIDLVSQ